MADKIKHSHDNGKLSHLERVIMLTQAAEKVGLDVAVLEGSLHNVFSEALQLAYDHGRTSRNKEVADLKEEISNLQTEIR